jgi:hypothetical protein
MNFKTTYVLFGALAALLAVLAVVLWRGPSPPSGERYVLSSMHDKGNPIIPEDVDRVEIEIKRPESPRLIFERNPKAENAADKEWRITAPRSLRADPGSIDNLVRQLYNAEPEKERQPESSKAAGLDSPQRVITLKKGDRSVSLTVGDVTPGTMDAVVYVTSSDRPKEALAVRKSSLAAALEGLNYFRSRDLLGSNTADIRDVTMVETAKGKDKKEVELKKETDGWWVVKPRRLDAALFEDKLKHLADLKVSYTDEKNNDFVQDDVTDLAAFKGGALDPAKSAVLRIEVRRVAEGKETRQALVIGVGKKVEPKGGDKKDKKDAKYYAYLDGGPTRDVVRISAEEVAPLLEVLKDPGSLRSKDLVRQGSPTAVVIDDHAENKKLELLRAELGPSWQLYQGPKDVKGQPAYGPEVDKLLNLLKDTKAQEFLDAPPKKASPEITVSLYEGAVEKSGAKKDGRLVVKEGTKPAAVLRFPRPEREATSVPVERDWAGAKAWVKVPRALFEQLAKGPRAYYDRALPRFTTDESMDQVTKLALKRPDQGLVEVARAKSDAPWKIERPAKQKGRDANGNTVLALLRDLNKLQATEVKALKASKSELKAYDLVDPPYEATVTVTKNGKGTTTTYSFGKKDKGAVYAKVSGHDAVYLVNDSILSELGGELRNTQVLTFAPRDVEEVKLRGWYDPEIEARTRTLVRKGGDWALKEEKLAAKYAVRGERVDALVQALSSLEASAFLEGGKGEKMKLAEGALIVEIALKDKKSLKLTLGGPTEKQIGLKKEPLYFASSPQMGGEVFLVLREPFLFREGDKEVELKRDPYALLTAKK